MNLGKIQAELKAPKNQYNSFGKYKYRSCEDILEAVKPLLGESVLTLSDTIKEAAGIPYVEATAMIKTGKDIVSVTAQAGINPNRKGMDIAQSFGSSSSYARKYALNGLFLIDDTKDPDTANNSAPSQGHGKSEKSSPPPPQEVDIAKFKPLLDKCKTLEDVDEFYNNAAKRIEDAPNKEAVLDLIGEKQGRLQTSNPKCICVDFLNGNPDPVSNPDCPIHGTGL